MNKTVIGVVATVLLIHATKLDMLVVELYNRWAKVLEVLNR